MSLNPSLFTELRLRPTYQAHEDRLNDFYIPVLERTVSYDRLVGYWRSSSLAVAASGVAHFIRNAMAHGGRMRVIAGARMTSSDIEAVMNGEPLEDAVARRLLDDPDELADLVAQERLRILAWMVREGLMEVKIGVPCDAAGRPVTQEQTDALFHTKFGIMTDSAGDRIVFEGSLNESAQGWQLNHEGFTVFKSWRPEIWEEYGRPWEETFEDHWENPEPVSGWKVVDLPEAVKDRLLERIPEDWAPPEVDPEVGATGAKAGLAKIAEAPHQIHGAGLVTLPIEPWPHQLQVASRIIDTWPRSYLLADEVGLGKTIEAGMVIRELLLSRQAERILVLVPASVQQQWQEELWEKFCLDVPSYHHGRFYDHSGKEVTASAGSEPWSAFPVVLASSHLARRRDRRDSVLRAGPWDLLFVDEAHHARRRGIGGAEGANQLLQLLRELRDNEMFQALILATATPMQMNTHEIFDLLDLFGLPGRWGWDEDEFDFYYRQLAEPDPKARDWLGIRQMLGDYLAQPDVQTSSLLARRLHALPLPARQRIERFHRIPANGSEIAARPAEERTLLDQWLRANTPLRERVFRTTRQALREYQRQGILSAEETIPRRRVDDTMIDLEPDEAHLYDRIERYISRYYEAYNRDKETKPLGFIMTVYRRRLTSSLAAIHRSLVRRLDAIRQNAVREGLLDEDDHFALESSDDFDVPEKVAGLMQEVGELEEFIADLEQAIPHDSKAERVRTELKESFLKGHRTVVVFTQFGDTLEWLRDQLRASYGSMVACYTGRGGSRWDAEANEWVSLPKEEVKELFRRGDEVRILIGTDAMSEGLNLQTCDRLINYDMPWNFMRVEQRIGRIDRIGGRPEVYVTNYFIRDTVEEQVYTGIQDDAQWFEQVVGPAQPVLGQVENVIQGLAMTAAGAARDQALADELHRVREAIKQYQERPVTLAVLEPDDIAESVPEPPFDLAAIEAELTTNPLTKSLLHPHPDFDHTYYVELGGEKHSMTFDRSVYDQNPEIGFLTYGHPVFEQLLGLGES